MKKIILSALILTAALWLPSACGGSAKPSVILLTVDGLRADRIGAYGYGEAQTPAMDRMAREGVRFDYAITASPLSLPAHATLMTGLYPARHGVRHEAIFTLPPKTPVMAEAFRKRGYETAAVVSSALLNRRFGLNRGFDLYRDDLSSYPFPFKNRRRPAVQGWNTVKEWFLSRQKQGAGTRPYFLWWHLFDTREAMTPHPDQASRRLEKEPQAAYERQKQLVYDASVSSVDEAVGHLLKFLDGQKEDVLVVLAGTHGHALGEHGEASNGLLLTDATVRVPLIFWQSGGGLKTGLVENAPVSLADLAPTLLEWAGADKKFLGDGISLTSVLKGGSAPGSRTIFAESFAPRYEYNWSPAFAAWRGNDTFVLPEAQYQDRAAGPRDEGPRDLEKSLREYAALTPGLEPALPAAELRVPLLQLGITGMQAVGKASWPSREFPASQGLPALALLEEGRKLLQNREAAGALQRLDRALAIDPLLVPASVEKANLLSALNRYPEAAAALKVLDDAGYATGHILTAKANVAERGGHAARADALYKEAVEMDEQDVTVLIAYASYLYRQGLTAEAEERWTGILEMDPANFDALASLGSWSLEKGSIEAAVMYLTKASDLRSTPGLLNELAIANVMLGRTEDAIHNWQHSLELEPNNPMTHFNLGKLFFRLGSAPAARGHLQTFLKLAGPAEQTAVPEARAILAELQKNEAAAAKK